jgi:hypothetical protein
LGVGLSGSGDPFRVCADGVLVYVRVTPRSDRNAVNGVVARGGVARIAIKVSAAPEDGKANAAVEQVLAAALGLRRSAAGVAAGHKDRDKTLLIRGNPTELAPILMSWLEEVRR